MRRLLALLALANARLATAHLVRAERLAADIHEAQDRAEARLRVASELAVRVRDYR